MGYPNFHFTSIHRRYHHIIPPHTHQTTAYIQQDEDLFTETHHQNSLPKLPRQNSLPKLFTETLHHQNSYYTKTFHQNSSPKLVTKTLHRNSSPKLFTETLHRNSSQNSSPKLVTKALPDQFQQVVVKQFTTPSTPNLPATTHTYSIIFDCCLILFLQKPHY